MPPADARSVITHIQRIATARGLSDALPDALQEHVVGIRGWTPAAAMVRVKHACRARQLARPLQHALGCEHNYTGLRAGDLSRRGGPVRGLAFAEWAMAPDPRDAATTPEDMEAHAERLVQLVGPGRPMAPAIRGRAAPDDGELGKIVARVTCNRARGFDGAGINARARTRSRKCQHCAGLVARGQLDSAPRETRRHALAKCPLYTAQREELRAKLRDSGALEHLSSVARTQPRDSPLRRHRLDRPGTRAALYYVAVGAPYAIYTVATMQPPVDPAAEKQPRSWQLILDACRQSARFIEAVASLRDM